MRMKFPLRSVASATDLRNGGFSYSSAGSGLAHISKASPKHEIFLSVAFASRSVEADKPLS
jgi:hypothetical protein